MTMTTSAAPLTAAEAIDDVLATVAGQPVFLCGSVVTAREHSLPVYGDVDLFVPTQQQLIATIQSMIDRGYTLDDRFDRVWHRWLRYGLKGWHTNSMRLHSTNDTPVNVVFKLADGHPTTSLAEVLESFDFGLLGIGIDCDNVTFRDMRPYLFPGLDVAGPLPLMPKKRDGWRQGFISQYNGLREAARYAKYATYGYDMSAVKDDLVTGYDMAAAYLTGHYDQDKQLLGEIYIRLSELIDDNDVDQLIESYMSLDYSDELDKIMEALV